MGYYVILCYMWFCFLLEVIVLINLGWVFIFDVENELLIVIFDVIRVVWGKIVVVKVVIRVLYVRYGENIWVVSVVMLNFVVFICCFV